ncbi:MAG: hypothetical protein Q7R40_16850 [Phaeospirillum sp.]|nr:hypothetical protein [Phaeospirillum sp.]
MSRLVPSVALLLLIATPALAALEPKHYVARRLTADFHLQVETAAVEEQAGGCRVEGRVVRRFASTAEALAPGDAVAFAIPCPADGFWPATRLKAAKLLEVFLRTVPGGFEAADDGEGMAALDAATETPTVRDDPALVREMTESIAIYSIDSEAKRSNPRGALALARVADPVLRVRLLAHAAGLFATKKMADADATGAEALDAFASLPPGDLRLETGLAALESLAMGGAKPATLRLADQLTPEIDALTLPTRRDTALLTLYGARIRSDDATAALAALAKVGNPKIRRERLDDMPFAQKDFGPANPASVAWMDRLLTAAEAQTDAAFKREALTALCRTAYRAAAGLVERPELIAKATPMAELAARRHHGPAAVLMAVLMEVTQGAAGRAEAARWYAVAGSGFDLEVGAATEAARTLAGFTPAERATAARLLGSTTPGAVTPKKLLDLAARK